MTDYLRFAREDADRARAQGGTAPDTDNPYLSLAREDAQAQQTRARTVLETALKDDPELAAERQRLSKTSGVPLRVVERNLEELRVKERARMIDLVNMAEQSPVLYRQLVDPTFTSVAQDDLPTLTKIERAINGAFRYATSADPNRSLMADAPKVGIDILAGATMGVGEGIFNITGAVYDLLGWDSGAADMRARANRSRETRQTFGLQPDSTTGQTVKDALGSTGTTLATLPVGLSRGLFATAQQAASAAAAIPASFVGADAYLQGREAGLGKVQSTAFGLTQGGFEYLFEKIPASKLFGDIAANETLLRTLGKQVVSEGWTEQVTTLAQDFNEWMNLHPEKTAAEFIAERPDAAYQTLIATLVGVGVQTTTIKGINKIVEKMSDQALTFEQDRLAEMLKAAGQSALRERSPEQFRAYAERVVNETDGAKKEVYVDAEVLAQLPPELLAQLPASVQEQIPAALEAGSTVSIPMADVLTVAPGTPLEQTLNDFARLTPDAITRVEAQQAADTLRQDAERVLQQAQDQAAAQQEFDAVQQDLLAQIPARGKYQSPAVRETYAAGLAHFFVAYGARTGLGTKGLYDAYKAKGFAIRGQASTQDAALEASKPGEISVTGYHFSKQDRPLLSTAFYGTGLQGSARDEIMNSPDARLRQRLSFYFDKGTGVRPESGVGGRAHRVNLTGVYDADADPLKLRTADARAFETKLLDLGYSGYATRMEGTQPGQVIMLGQQTFRPDLLGAQSSITSDQVLAPVAREPQWQTQASGSPEQLQAQLGRMQSKPAWRNYEMRIEGNELQVRELSDTLAQSRVKTITPAVRKLLKALTPMEQRKVTDGVAAKIIAQLQKLPSAKEMAAVALGGQAKRGWYKQSAEAISAVFGPDAPRFAALLAALSPQCSVETNLLNTLNTWKNWVAAGRPTEREAIIDVMGQSVQGGRGRASVLDAWINNSVRSLTAENPGDAETSRVLLSGPKVNSFFLNLIGVTDEVTNDAWMANYALVDQVMFSGSMNVLGTDPGKGSGYMAMSARTREAAAFLTKTTGETWTPAEVQETVWSWAKTLYELQVGDVTATGALQSGMLTDELINATPDFSSLFNDPAYADILKEAGYADQLDALRSDERPAAGDAGETAGSGPEAAALTAEDQRRLQLQAARRLERLREQRAAGTLEQGGLTDGRSQPTGDGAGRYSSGSLAPLEGAPTVEGATGPDARLVAVAEQYALEAGIDLKRQGAFVQVDEDRARRIAAAYEEMQHAPNDPMVKEAYEDLARQTLAQYLALQRAGYQFYLVDETNDPYAGNPWNAMRDLRANQSMGVFATEAGFGSSDLDVSDNPLLADTGLEWGYGTPDGPKKRVLFNDLFRAVHDAFGHGLEGAGFRARGEENAWQAHVRLFTGPAVGAITSETRGQNSWLNYGPNGEANQTAKVEDTVFADQKTGLMPEWTWSEGRAPDASDTLAQMPTAAAAFTTTYTDRDGQTYELRLEQETVGMGADRQLSVRVGAYQGEERRARIDFAVDGNTLAAENTITAPAYRGKGLAEAMYRAAREAGYDISPGRKQTADGDKMVSALQRKGVINRDRPLEQQSVDQTQTPEFKAWFGDSKVVDGQGKPLVVYHGTKADIAEFDLSRAGTGTDSGGWGRGFYFSADPGYAGAYAGRADGSNIVPAYVSLQNPFVVDARERTAVIRSLGLEVPRGDPTPAWAQQLADALTQRGHDGVLVTLDGKPAEIVAFRPEQIKSATGNDGSFDANDPSILSQKGDTPRGTFSPSTLELVLNPEADLSTLWHEMGHFFLEVLADVSSQPNAPAQIVADWQTVLKQFGVTDEQWRGFALNDKRNYHEQWARFVEAYVMEGKVPNAEMAPLMRRFSAWLKSVYGSIKAFLARLPADQRPEINDDIRRVMDRMLATDEQIAEANEAAGLMPDETADAEAQERLRKRSMADLKWTVKARDKVIREMQKKAASIRKGIVEEVTVEANQTPEMRAKAALDALRITPEYQGILDNWKAERETAAKDERARLVAELYDANPDAKGLQKGQLLAKNKREITNKVDAFLIEWDRTNPKPSRPVNMNDEDMATVADSFGYPSVNDMLESIAAFGSKQDYIDARTEQRMLEEHGDLMNEDAIKEAANEAVHNEARARSLASELRTQAEMLRARQDTGEVNAKGSKVTVSVLMAAAKQFAANVVGRTTLQDLKAKAWQHTAAERRAAKKWQEATAAGKTEEAVQAKQDQVLNNAAAKAALDARTDGKKMLDFFARVLKGNDETTVEKGRDADIVNAARAVLQLYGLQSPASKSAAAYLEALKRNDPDTWAAIEPMVAAASENAQPILSLTYDELVGLHEQIQGMWYLAKRSRQMEIDGDLLDIEDLAGELAGRLQEIGIPDRIPGEGMAVTKAEERGLFLKQGIAFLRRVEQWAEGMDGKYGGPFLRYVFQPVKDAADRYRKDRLAYRKRFQALVDNLAPIVGDSVIAAPELGYTFGTPGSSAGTAMNEILHALLHTGNQSNKRKLLVGRGWAAEGPNGELDTTRWDAFVQRLVNEGKLERAHMDFVQGVWDLLEDTKPLAQKTHRDVFGRYFAEVTADAFTDPFGVERRGGYVPAQVDSRLVKDNALKKLAEEENNSMAFAFPQPAKGFTMTRVEGYTRPLMLDLRTLSQHLDKVLLFAHMTPATRGVRKLLSNKLVGQPLDRVQPAAVETMLQPWLARSAQQVVEDPIVGAGKWARLPGIIRARAGMALMFANVSNTLQQITGLSTAAVRVGPAHLTRALAAYVASPRKFSQAVWDTSPYMADRADNEVAVMNEQMQDILIKPGVYQRAQSWSMRHAYFLQTAFDNVLSPIVWTGAYNQALAEGMSDTDAIKFADGTVRQTQGSTLPEDVSRLETGPAYARVFTQFVGYFNMMANTNGTALKQIANEVGLKKGAGKAFYVVMLGLMAPIWVAEAIAQAFRGGPEDEDKDGYLDDWLAAVFGFGTLKGLLAQIPIAGQFAVAGMNRMNDNPLDDRASLSPAISLLEASVGAPESVYKAIVEDGSAQKAIRDVSTLVSVATGIPVYGAARPLGYLAGVADDRIDPTGPVDLARGVVTGTASSESKQR
jgi:hypothetical protein